ncbi:alpha/beta hydrolase [Schaalia sp. ORNL0103]|uniref:alpha/beta hydrolase n=1 Tax=Schaalia sp. ORNL0103 TaxID=2789426 RepID=UPI001CA50D90|nr:alpha/beta hydrolase-fold protein [Schaalia sp. ORNL0103]MBW6412126.1 esterase [Schaalia sp. ORNL0103]
MGVIAASVAITLSLFGLAGLTSAALHRTGHGQKDPAPVSYEEDGTTSALATRALEGTIQEITYEQAYEGVTYEKEALVYVPASYTPGVPVNIVYLTHGWWGTADGLAEGVAPVVDQLTSDGSIAPTIVVFATYYPDRSFATDDYEDDYALNRFFATSEIDTLIDAVESRYTTFARGDTSDQSLRASRRHRAFGGFSMGATTTWDVFALRPQYFYGYMPMAGESWIGREEDADSPRIAELVTAGVERAQYGPQDFRVLASVGSEDPALWDMTPQIDELREDYPDLMTEDSLQLWIDDGETHSMTSIANQVEHNLPLLFPGK